jgi:hypothetical protein
MTGAKSTKATVARALHALQEERSGRTTRNSDVARFANEGGGTAVAIREMYPKAHFVTIFAKPAGRPLVDDYVIDIPQDTWIEQPWDMGVVFVPPISGR